MTFFTCERGERREEKEAHKFKNNNKLKHETKQLSDGLQSAY